MIVMTMLQDNQFSLVESVPGQVMRILSLPRNDLFYYHFIRLGIHEGQVVTCYEKLPGGTIVLRKNRQYVAVGHTLAQQIVVVLNNEGALHGQEPHALQ